MALAEAIRARLAPRPPAVEAEASRADPVTLEEFGALLAGRQGDPTYSGVTVTPVKAMGLSAWYSGVRYIAETIAGLPVAAYRKPLRGALEPRGAPRWMGDPEGGRGGPAADQTWFGLVETWVMSLLHRGNAYAWKRRNDVGQVVELHVILPDTVTVGIAPDGTKRFRVGTSQQEFTTRDILHVPGLSLDGKVGVSPILWAANSLGTALASEEYAGRFFGQGTHMGGVISLQQKLTPTQRAEAQEEWDAFHRGLQHAHQTGVLGNGAKYERLALTASDAQLLESRKYGVLEVARILRLPPHKLYELTHATYSNIEHQSIEAATDGIRPWVTRLEAWMAADPDLMPAGNVLRWDMDALQRGDTTSRYAAIFQATGGPWMTGNEGRAKEGLAPLPHLDDVLRPVNMGVAGEEPPEPAPAPAPPTEDPEEGGDEDDPEAQEGNDE